jgi:hypothetical protein
MSDFTYTMEEGNNSPPSPKSDEKRRSKIISIIIVIIILSPIIFIALNPSISFIPWIKDSDDDGTPDSDDPFPDNPYEWIDSDDDGYGDNSDVFPNDPNEWLDTDHDGVGNNEDAFPSNFQEQYDSDNDGIGNNADIYDYGNGKIRINIDYFEGDGTADQGKSLEDVYFTIRVDTNPTPYLINFDLVRTSDIFFNSRILNDPYSIIVDIDDDATSIGFTIEVREYDEGYLPGYGIFYIDYNPSPGSINENWMTQRVNSPFNNEWTYDGSADGRNELDCILSYSIEVVH